MKILEAGMANPLKTLLILFVLVLTSACQSSVSGVVFIDENRNGRLDPGELGIPYAKLMVTRDNEVVAENFTDASGAFFIPIKQRPGYVCLEPDFSFAEANLHMLFKSMGKELPPKAFQVSPPPKALQYEIYDLEGEDEAPKEKPATTVETIVPKGPQGWVGTRYCQQVKYRGFEVDIPVTMDFTEALAAMPRRLPVTCYAGDSCVIRLIWPQGCSPKPIVLPRGLEAEEQAGVEYDHAFNMVSFGDVTLVPSAETKAQAGVAMPATGGFEIFDLTLAVSDSIDVGVTEELIEISADCMDQQIELNPISVELVREIELTVHQHLMTPLVQGHLKPGNDVKVQLTVANIGKSSVSNGRLTFTPPTGSQLYNVGGCHHYGTRLICPEAVIEAGAEKKWTAEFKLSQDLYEWPTYVDCMATFSADGLESPLEAEAVRFLVKPESSD